MLPSILDQLHQAREARLRQDAEESARKAKGKVGRPGHPQYGSRDTAREELRVWIRTLPAGKRFKAKDAAQALELPTRSVANLIRSLVEDGTLRMRPTGGISTYWRPGTERCHA